MTTLTEVLGVRGVPNPSDADALARFGDELLTEVEADGLLRDLDAYELSEASRMLAPEFIALAEAALRVNHPDAYRLSRAASQALPQLTRLILREAADVALNCPHLTGAHGRQLAAALFDRVQATRKDGDGLAAYAYLETLTRLALIQSVARFRAMEVLSSITLDDPGDLLEQLPRLVGIARDTWGEAELDRLLNLLLEHGPARSDALVELALASLRDALEGPNLEAVMTGLIRARAQFLQAEAIDEVRDDATILRCVLDAVLAFSSVGSNASTTKEVVVGAANRLAVTFARRQAWSTRPGLGGWAAPRRQAEAEWFALARTLQQAADPLSRPSWLTPAVTLGQVLEAYRASRSLTIIAGDGLKKVLEPAVEAAFINREGLLAHLRDVVEEDGVAPENVAAAHELLDAVSNVSRTEEDGDTVGKALAVAPDLTIELGAVADTALATAIVRAASQAPALIARCNTEAQARAKARLRSGDALVDTLLDVAYADLADCEDFTGSAREEFVELLTYIFRFMADRADVGKQSGGPNIVYLFKRTDGKHFTEDYLQRDVATWLRASPLRPYVRVEERDVAAGRADLTVTQNHRFSIEIKRELMDASPDALRNSYGGQAAAYSSAGPRMSVALVLDLTNHSHGVPSLQESTWVDKVAVPGAVPRHVVMGIVRGNRIPPNETRAG